MFESRLVCHVWFSQPLQANEFLDGALKEAITTPFQIIY
jgi:hypothetical protein